MVGTAPTRSLLTGRMIYIPIQGNAGLGFRLALNPSVSP